MAQVTTGWEPILRPFVCETETKPLHHCDGNNFLFQILQQFSEKLNKFPQTSHRNYKWGHNADESVSKTRW